MNLASPSIVRAGRVFGTSLSRWMLVISVLLLNCERELPVVDDDSPETSGRTSAAKSNDPVVAAADNTRPDWQPAKPLDFYRIDFVRQDRAVHVDEITRLTSPLRPLPALSPEYLLVARHAGDVVAVVPLTFPTSAHSLEIGPNGEVAHSRLEVTTSSASAFVEITASIDALDLLDTKTNVVLHIDAAELPQRAGASGKVVGQSQPLTAGNLRTRYPHILFLRPQQSGRLDAGLLMGGTVMDIPDALATALDAGLAKLAPAVLSAVQAVAVVSFPASVAPPQAAKGYIYGGFTQGPQIVLNVALGPALETTITHESAHALDFLSYEAGTGKETNSAESFEPQTLAAAKALVQRFGFVAGIFNAWSALHKTGVRAGYATDYRPADWEKMSAAEATLGGFATPYGGAAPAEDFAEYVSELTHFDTKRPPAVCDRFQGGPTASPALAVSYAKLVVLYAIGAINQMPYTMCLAGFSMVPQNPGIVFQKVATFSDQLSASYSTEQPKPASFTIAGNGPSGYRVAITVKLPVPGSAPIGVYRLGDIWLGNVLSVDSFNRVALLNDDKSLTRASTGGLLLISNASKTSAEGVIFGLGLQNFLGIQTDSFLLVPFKVP